MKRRTTLIIVAASLLLPIAGLALLSSMATRPTNLGIRDGRFVECPDKPNCVSTQATDSQHQMKPVPFDGSLEDVTKRVKAALAKLSRLKIVTEKPDYIHAEARSLIFRFVDDVEVYIDADAKLIHFRSASRVGYSDLDANRSRMNQFRDAFVGTAKD